jgi:methionyl-tRNA formyltransferase
MRIVFCGSGAFAAPALEALARSGHCLALVATQPARPGGRGGKMHATPVAQAARTLGIEPFECENVNADAAVEKFRQAQADVMCVIDFGQFIRAAARATAPLGAFNLHGSLLPELRGAAPVNWAILRGHRRTGVTTFSLVDKMDAGAMYLQAATDISPEETAEELKKRLSLLGAQTILDTLDLLAGGSAIPRPQDESRVTFAPLMKKSDGVIDWSADAESIRNRVHGCWPWPGAQAEFHGANDKIVPVILARASADSATAASSAGTVEADRSVATGRGRLRILEIKPAGGRLMKWADFVNGYRVAAGHRFDVPRQELQT